MFTLEGDKVTGECSFGTRHGVTISGAASGTVGDALKKNKAWKEVAKIVGVSAERT